MSTQPIRIEQVMPWGRSMDEYVRLFALAPEDLQQNILSCADGPASFNAEMTALGHRVTSVDPVYAFTTEQIRTRIAETRNVILANTAQHHDAYRWDAIRDLDALDAVRMAAMEGFLKDFEVGKAEGRYIEGALPELSFDDDAFDLVVCSHCLFTYTEQLDVEFHIAAMREMLRVGQEVRVFPLLDMNGGESKHVEGVEAALIGDGFFVERVRVGYEFQIGGDTMLRVLYAKS